MSANDICFKTENAIVTFLKSVAPFSDIPAASVYGGMSLGLAGGTSGDETEQPGRSNPLPNILVVCQRATQDHVFEGNWKAFATIEIASQVDDSTPTQCRARTGAAIAAFMTATIADDISAAILGYAAQQVIVREQSWDIRGRRWIGFLNLELACCGTDSTAPNP